MTDQAKAESQPRRTAPVSYPCQKCGVVMRIQTIAPDGPEQEKRTFECPSCKATETVIVKYR